MPLPLHFRCARTEDVDAAIALTYNSGPVAFDYVFAGTPKDSAQDFLRKAFVNDRSEPDSHAAALKGYAGGKPANEPAPYLRTVVARL